MSAKKCMASKHGSIFGERCLEPAAYVTATGVPNCQKHAEQFIDAVMSPNTIVGMLTRNKWKEKLPSREQLRQLYLRAIN